MVDARYNVVVIGGGIVGLAVALEITRRFPRLRLLLVEKEEKVARHQSGHNSGVIHSGVYYKAGSLKARLCVAGAAEMIAFCNEHDIPHKVCGKVIVATGEEELPGLEELRRRGEANGVSALRLISGKELREIEPHASGLGALLVPSTGVTDFALVSEKYAQLTAAQGGTIMTSAEVTGIHRRTDEIIVQTQRGTFSAKYLINCAGLFSDRVSRMAGDEPQVMIVPFRGEYYTLVPARESLVRALIYPIPDPRFPFLGVHFTRRVSLKVDAGPNAVLALQREGYRRTNFKLRDTASLLTFPGFWRMALRYGHVGCEEFYRSFSKRAFVGALQRLVPEVRNEDLAPAGTGVRAQALNRDGTLVDDFQFFSAERTLHVLNVPSPAATASRLIARTIVDTASRNLGLV